MIGPNRSPAQPRTPDLELDETLTQEIDSPFNDVLKRHEEPTLSKIDFEDIEIALDL